MDLDRVELQVTFGLVGQGVVAAFCKVAFSSRKALVAKKEANCCWRDSYWSFNIHSSDSSRCSNVGSEVEWDMLHLT